MTEESQTKPLTPPRTHPRSDEEETESKSIDELKKLQRKKQITKCTALSITAILLLATLITILSLTVFRVKSPQVKMNRITIRHFSLASIPKTIKILAEVGLKNPNIASYKYDNSTTMLSYHGTSVGKAHTPRGEAKAGRTKFMNLSMEIVTEKIIMNPNFAGELGAGKLTVSSYTRLDGRIRLLKIIKKHVVVKMNCTFTANITSQEILDQVMSNFGEGCFECGEFGHWRGTCPWIGKPCVRGCGQRMKLLTSKRERSKGCRFLKCHCGGFSWVDEPMIEEWEKYPLACQPSSSFQLSQDSQDSQLSQASQASTSNETGGTLKVTFPGPNPIIVEGSVAAITELMRNLRS